MVRSVAAMLAFASSLVFGMVSAAQPGGAPAPLPQTDPFTCELPTPTNPAIVSYRLWLIGQANGDAQAGNDPPPFCTTMMGVQKLFTDNGLHLQFYPPPGTPTPCPDLPISPITDAARESEINATAKALDAETISWQEVHQFIVQGTQSVTPYFEPGSINVYVLDPATVSELRGMHVRDVKVAAPGDLPASLIFVPYTTFIDSLAHEFAHAFTLEHVNFWGTPQAGQSSDADGKQQIYCAEYGYFDNRCDFDPTNVMWAAGEDRSGFSSGQAVRIVCNDWSALNINGDRDGGTFKCPDWSLVDLNTAVAPTPVNCPRLDGLSSDTGAPL